MSLTTKYYARKRAENMSNDELESEIMRLENAPDIKGHEFGDTRSRHKRRTRINTYKSILNERT